jgi:hypothetical protein
MQMVYNYSVTLNISNQIVNTVQDSWTVSTVRQTYSFHGNQTMLTYEFQLRRSSQPVSLPTISYATVVLLAAAMLIDPEKISDRLTVFLGAIVLSLSVLISQNLNPFGFGNTIFETYFSYLMFANAILVLSSVLVWRFRSHLVASSATDVAAGIVVAWISVLFFRGTQLPWWVWISPIIVPMSGLSASFFRTQSQGEEDEDEFRDDG